MDTSVQTIISLPQVHLLSSHHIAVPSNENMPPISPMPSQLSGSDVVNIIIAISVLVGAILGKSNRLKQ